MRVIPPITITDAILTSSNAPETAPAAYNAGTTYAANATATTGTAGGVLTVWRSLQAGNVGHTPASSPTWWVSTGTTYSVWDAGTSWALGDMVIVVGTNSHKIYESLQAANLNHTPAATDPDTWWLDSGSTNKMAMFDLLRNTPTTLPTSVAVTLTPGQRCNSLAVLGMTANSLTISATSVQGGGTVFTDTVNLNTREVLDWSDYYFAPFSTKESYISFDIPLYSDIIISITATATSGDASIGSCILGTYVDIGNTQHNAVSDVLNFSIVTRDSFGNSLLSPRRNIPKTNQTIWAKKIWINKILKLRETLNAAPAVWSGLSEDDNGYFEALLILGIYKQFSINMQYPDYAVITLELEEV